MYVPYHPLNVHNVLLIHAVFILLVHVCVAHITLIYIYKLPCVYMILVSLYIAPVFVQLTLDNP